MSDKQLMPFNKNHTNPLIRRKKQQIRKKEALLQLAIERLNYDK